MQDLGYYRILSYLVSLNNDNDSILASDLLNNMYSYYTNMLKKQDKNELINLASDLLTIDSNKDLVKDLDSFKDYTCNKKSLLQVLHILKINL